MKKIYEKDNVDNTLLQLQNRYRIAQNRTYSIEHIICAFNMLPGKYQDLLLKPKKDENDKVSLVMVYKMFQSKLKQSENAPKGMKINIKNLDKEEVKKSAEITMEDVETGGDKWIRKDKKTIVPEYSSTFVIKMDKKKTEEPKEIEEPVIEEPDEFEEVQTDEVQIEEIDRETKEGILRKYIENRKLINIEELLKELGISDLNYFIICEKFKNNSVRSSQYLEKKFNISANYIDSVVDEFFAAALELNKKKKKTNKLVERK